MELVHRAIHEAVLEAGPKVLAHAMGMSHTNLLNRVNPNDDSHRLTFEQFLQVLVHSKDVAPLQAIASELGFELVPKGVAEQRPISAALIDAAVEMGDVTREVAEALADGRITQIERAGINREIAAVRKSLYVLEEAVRVAG